jgi:hypothetical protein
VDGANLESCAVVDFGISGVKLSGSPTIQHRQLQMFFVAGNCELWQYACLYSGTIWSWWAPADPQHSG